jgi:hypothetical protein
MPDYSEQLAQAQQQDRAKRKKIIAKIPTLIAQRMTKAVEDKDAWVWPFAFILAAFNDGVDILGLGSIPFLGDFLDLFCGVILTMFLWNIGGMIKWKLRIAIWLATGLETILGLAILPEFIPFWVLAVWYAHHKIRKKAEVADRGLKALKKGEIDKEAIGEFS